MAASKSVSVCPGSYDSKYLAYSVSDLGNGLTDSSSGTYATIQLTRGNNAETSIFYSFSSLSIPAGSTLNSISCSVKCYINQTSSTYIGTREVQLYSGSTARGDSHTVSNSTTAFNMSPGKWTLGDLENPRLRIHAVRTTSNTSSNYYFRFYGATLSVSYTEPATGNTILVKSGGTWKEALKVYVKVGGVWEEVSKVMKNVSGSWVESSDLSDMFDPGATYIKGE